MEAKAVMIVAAAKIVLRIVLFSRYFKRSPFRRNEWRIPIVPNSLPSTTRGSLWLAAAGRRSHPRGDLIKMGPPGRRGMCGTPCRQFRYGTAARKFQLVGLNLRHVDARGHATSRPPFARRSNSPGTVITVRNEPTALALFRGRGLRHGCEKNDRPISLRNGSADPMHPGANERRRGRAPPHDP